MLEQLTPRSARGVQNKSLRLQCWAGRIIFIIELEGEGEEGPPNPRWLRRLLFRTYRNRVATKIRQVMCSSAPEAVTGRDPTGQDSAGPTLGRA